MRYKFIFLVVFLFCLAEVFAQELALVREKGKIGFIDTSGAFVIPPKFDNARSFSEGYAAAEKNNLWGFINTSGEWVIQPKYNRAKNFNSGYALVLKKGGWNYIDKEEKVLNTPPSDKYYDFQDGGVAFVRNGFNVGLIGTDGAIILAPKYGRIQSFVNGHAVVTVNDILGMINLKGEWVIPLEYEKLGDYNPKGVWGKKNGEYGLIIDGIFEVLEGVNKIWNFSSSSDLRAARKKSKVGFIDTKGAWVINPAFDDAKSFNKGMAPVSKNGEWGFINESGKLLIPFRYEDIESFSDDGLAAIKINNWGFMNTKGAIVIPPKYSITPSLVPSGYISSGFKNGVARVKYKRKWGFLNTEGEVLGGKWYENAEPFVSVK